jgi:hypothetical protein
MIVCSVILFVLASVLYKQTGSNNLFAIFKPVIQAIERVCNYIDQYNTFNTEFENRSIHVFRNPTKYRDF